MGQPPIEDATYGSVRGAVAAARAGVATRLEGTVALSAEEALAFAQSLLRDGGPAVTLRLDGMWLDIEPLT